MARVLILSGFQGSGKKDIFNALMKLNYTRPLMTIDNVNTSKPISIDGISFDGIIDNTNIHQSTACDHCHHSCHAHCFYGDNECHTCIHYTKYNGVKSLIDNIDFDKSYTYIAIMSYKQIIEFKRALDNRCNVITFYVDKDAKACIEYELSHSTNYTTDKSVIDLCDIMKDDYENLLPNKSKYNHLLDGSNVNECVTRIREIIEK